MAESATNKRVMAALRAARLDPVRVENSACPGTPDINCSLGWIENKYVGRWPTSGRIMKVPHFTPQQRVWLKRRTLFGGRCWMMLQVGRELLLLEGSVAAELVGLADEETLRRSAVRVWSRGLSHTELLECLQRSPSQSPSLT